VTPLTVTPSTWRQCVEAGERFRRTANSAPELIVCNLADGSCEFVNDTWLQLGDGWQQVVHPGHGERFLSLYWEALQKASVSIFRTSDVAPQFQTGGENGLSHDVAQTLVSAGAETLLGAPGRWMPLAKRVEMSLVSTQQAGVPAPRKRAHPKFHDFRSSEFAVSPPAKLWPSKEMAQPIFPARQKLRVEIRRSDLRVAFPSALGIAA
jgi:hypothetical protein